jgi:hypothetical protein
MIGIDKISPGRLGNRLFHYNFLRQISKKTGIGYFHIQFPEISYFSGMDHKTKHGLRIRKPIEVTSRDVLTFSPQEFLDFVHVQNKKGRDILFSPPMLGEVFFDYLFFDPNDFILINNEFRIDNGIIGENTLKIGVHFRGADFSAWNEKAALKFEYYRSAISFCMDEFTNNVLAFSLFTDDLEYPAYKQSLSYLNTKINTQVVLGNPNKSPAFDLYLMSQCDILISSPSTFAIFGGILGKRKKIIHDKSWMDHVLEINDPFWVRLNSTSNPYYQLWKTF